MSNSSPSIAIRPVFYGLPPLRAGLSAFCLLLSLLSSEPVLAAAATDARGSAKFQAGRITVTALLDRSNEMDLSLFSGPASPEQRRKFMPGGKAPASVNAFLLRLEDGKNVLVDAGFGTVMPGASQLDRCLADNGLTPDDIDIVLLTHMHSDHIGGLLKRKRRAFPRARIMVSRTELEYWTGLTAGKSNANATLVQAVLDAYGQDVLPPFVPGGAILPGVTALDAPGHTPGHSVFLAESDGGSLLIIGDILHAAALQFPLPEECAVYDMNARDAARARKSILGMAAEKNIPVAGMHIPFPGMGTVKSDGAAGFSFTPLP